MSFDITKEALSDLVTSDKKQQRKFLQKRGGVEGIAKLLKTNLEEGLSPREIQTGASSRVAAFGANTLPDPPSAGFFELLWEALQDTTLIILSVAAVISLVFGIAFPPPGEGGTAWIEGAAILITVALVAVVGAGNNYAKERKFRQLDKQKETKPVEVIRGGKSFEISNTELLVGDVVLLGAGEKIPADGLFIDGRGGVDCRVDNSVMTGETVAVVVDKEKPVMMSGATIDEGLAKMLVIAVGEESQYGILFKNLQQEKTTTPLEDKLDKLAEWIGWGGLGAAVAIFAVLMGFFLYDQIWGSDTITECIAVPSINSQIHLCSQYEEDKKWDLEIVNDIVKFIIIAITIVVVAVPEGLPLAVTLSLAYSMQQMMKDNCLVRRLAACETMGGATTICSDKTGTLTENRMTVVAGWIGGEEFRSVPPDFEIDDRLEHLLCDGIAINTKANVNPAGDEAGALPQFMGNKTECALIVFAGEINPGFDYRHVRKTGEEHEMKLFNFTSDRKRMSTVVRVNDRDPSSDDPHPFRMYIKGASELIVDRSTRMMAKDGRVRRLERDHLQGVSRMIEAMADEGLRTIGLAYREFDDPSEWEGDENDKDWEPPENELVLLAVVGIKDPIRKEVPAAVRTCQEAGIVVRMVTGDNIKTATRIAKDCGILTNGIAMTGPEFRAMSDADLDAKLPHLQVLARSIPSDKKRLVERLRHNREVVAVTGDGVNDGPALKAAHVGLAMGLSGTDVARQASDIVILDDNFKSIVLAVMWGRCVYDNIKKFLQFQLTVNFSALAVALIGAIAKQGTPLTAVQLLWVNLIMDTMAALALGTEKPTPDLLQRKPYGLNEKVPISAIMWRNILGQGIYQIVVLVVILFVGASIFDVEDQGEEHYTIIFNTFVWMQIFNEINSRKVNNEMNVFKGLLTNWLFVAVIVITVIMQILLVQFGGEAVKTKPLTFVEWLACLGLGFVAIPLGFVIRLAPVDKLASIMPSWLMGKSSPEYLGIDDADADPLLNASDDDSDGDSDYGTFGVDVEKGAGVSASDDEDSFVGQRRDKGKGKKRLSDS